MKSPSPAATMALHCTGLSQITSAHQYFNAYKDIVAQMSYSAIDEIVDELLNCYLEGRAVFLFGNGGSAALASHFACDLGKGTLVDGNAKARFRVFALTDNIPLITAWANDSSYERIFSEQLQNLISPRDVAFGISGSGNSPNVLAALRVARATGAVSMGLTGFDGGKMKSLCDYCVVVPSNNMQLVEDFHLGVVHAMFTVIRQRISEIVSSSLLVRATASE